MSTTAEEYRVKAIECERLVRETMDPDIKEQLWALARNWRALAEHAERWGM
jgi:hypothetical protein